jgi:hypothetical protein
MIFKSHCSTGLPRCGLPAERSAHRGSRLTLLSVCEFRGRKIGDAKSTIVQTSSQSNIIDPGGSASIDIAIGGDHKGASHHIDVGNESIAVQSNAALRLAEGGGGVPPPSSSRRSRTSSTPAGRTSSLFRMSPRHPAPRRMRPGR